MEIYFVLPWDRYSEEKEKCFHLHMKYRMRKKKS